MNWAYPSVALDTLVFCDEVAGRISFLDVDPVSASLLQRVVVQCHLCQLNLPAAPLQLYEGQYSA